MQQQKQETNTDAKEANNDNTAASKRGSKRVSSEPDPLPAKSKRQKLAALDDDEESTLSSAKEVKTPQEETQASIKPTEPDDSDLSSLLDEDPAPRKKKRQKSDAPKKQKAAKAKPAKASAKPKAKADADLSPQEAEIKRLQGWLLKCGIRKLWHRELAPYTTDKEKINHLKDMLKDVGMDGRYSVEKAKQIKERRELAADLEAVQEGNKIWGQEQASEDDDSGGAKPKRRLAKGLRDLGDFMDDGEESD